MKKTDYRIFGIKIIYNVVMRNLSNLNLNLTERCNSKCKTCYIWKKQPKHDISVDVIEKILNDKIVNKKTLLGLTGGEALLHPNIDDILELFSGYNYLLFSNGIMADKLIETVKKHDIKSLLLSADGIDETYKRIRGVDNFKNIRKIVHELKDTINISIDFTINPLNEKKDLLDIVNFCENNNLILNVGIYNQPEYFDTIIKPKKAFEFGEIKSKCFHTLPKWLPFPISTNSDYIKLYNKWIFGKLDLPCFSIRSSLSIMPNADVSLCQGKNIIIGNLHKTSLSEMWNSKKIKEMQKKYRTCNDCFLTCQRPVDIFINSSPVKWFIR